MKSFTKVLKTKREIAEIMLRPISLNLPDKYKERCIDKIIVMSNIKFVKEARSSTNLDIVPFINDMYFIRYEII